MSGVELRGVKKSFGAVEVIKDVDLEIKSEEFVVFVGPSGCGKSTLLRIIAGLESVSGGEVVIGDTVMNDVDPSKRGIAMVFQSYALYPHMSVRDNMGFALRYAGMPKAEIERQVLEAARILELEHLLERRPKELSGGQRQRVAIGRAIVRHPEVFLFDEPLSNLDAELRVHMRIEIARLHKELQSTIIYVTHDQVEAMTLADKIVVLREGVIEQIGTPLELYDDPDNQFVAGFIGSPKMNFMPGVVEKGALKLDNFGGQTIPLGTIERKASEGETLSAGLRPEHFSADGSAKLAVTAEIVEHLGGETFVYATHEGGDVLTIGMQDGRKFKPGDEFDARFDPSRLLFFGKDGERIR